MSKQKWEVTLYTFNKKTKVIEFTAVYIFKPSVDFDYKKAVAKFRKDFADEIEIGNCCMRVERLK